MKQLAATLLLAAGVALIGSPAAAENGQASSKSPASQTKKSAVSKKQNAVIDEEDKEPDVSAAKALEYECELGNKLTVYRNLDDAEHIALRWKKRLLRLTKVETTTGAHRFENRRNGWVWIDIPAKGLLLDSKKGQQLANECKHPEGAREGAASAS